MKKHLFLLLLGTTLGLKTMAPQEKSLFWVLANMPLEHKIAQLLMVPIVPDESMNQDFMAQSPYRMDHAYVLDIIKKYNVGNIIFLGKGTKQSILSTKRLLEEKSRYPILFAIDAEWGLNMRLEDTPRLPRALTLGALPAKNNNLISQLGYEIGKSCKELGISMNFAPVLDVNTNPLNPIIGTRSFGQKPSKVAVKAFLYAHGLARANVIACAKHFPGHGDTSDDSHKTLPIIQHDRTRLDKVELHPFKYLIKQGICAIMIGHLHVPALDTQSPSSLSSPIIQDLLQQQMGFEGLIITDGLGMRALENKKPGEIELEAFLAGNDILLGVLHVPETVELIKKAVLEGKISEMEINRRLVKVLHTKEWAAQPLASTKNNDITETLKKDIFVRSLTLVKNDNKILPFKENQKIQLYSDARSKQKSELAHTFEKFIKLDQNADTIIVPVYPHNKLTMIEQSNQNTHSISPEAELISQLQKQNKKVVAVLFDTPYKIDSIAHADAIICTYEDDPWAEKCAAWALAGCLNPSGILPVSVGRFNVGTSLNYSSE